MRFASADEPLRWYISQPAKWGPLTSHFSRLPSEVRTKAPLRVPTKTRTLVITYSPGVNPKSENRNPKETQSSKFKSKKAEIRSSASAISGWARRRGGGGRAG